MLAFILGRCLQSVKLVYADSYTPSFKQLLEAIPSLNGSVLPRLFNGQLDTRIKQDLFHLIDRILGELTTPQGVLRELDSNPLLLAHRLVCFLV